MDRSGHGKREDKSGWFVSGGGVGGRGVFAGIGDRLIGGRGGGMIAWRRGDGPGDRLITARGRDRSRECLIAGGGRECARGRIGQKFMRVGPRYALVGL